MTRTKLLGAAAGALFASAVGASAAVVELDFLDFTAAGAPTSGTLAGTSIDWKLTAEPDALTHGTNGIGGNAGTKLDALSGRDFAGDVDGFGIDDDEVDFPNEYMTLSFSEEVALTGAYFLDLFQDSDIESANISIGDTPALPADSVTFATDVAGSGFGYGEFAGSLRGTSFTFFAGPGFDDPSGDFALAGVVISSVPLPAGMLLMGTALGGLGLMRRRKKA